MCGIAGWADLTLPSTEMRERVQRMNDAMSSRGPDGDGIWSGRHAVLGHRRLAVLDPAHGQQPMVFTDDSDEPVVALTYSGEVYNHRELRDELERRGHKFRTATDTEVVLHAYLEWGVGALSRLNGMYAFAVWDQLRGRLVLVRDRLGVKPLHYARNGAGLLFASEPKSLFASGLVSPSVSTDGLRDFLASVHTPGTSLFHGVHEVRPGTVVILDAHGVHEQQYWQLEARPHHDDVGTTITHVADLLQDITARHVEAVVPLGALLSGGLDSSALVALGQQAAHRLGMPPLRTFSVDFAGNADHFTGTGLRSTPDAPFVRDVAARCGVDHRNIVLDATDLTRHRQAVVTAKDAPALGDMDTSMYLLFRAVREHTTVVISGESADEVFGGYPWFHDPDRVGADDYPWRYLTGHSGTYQALLRDDVAAELGIAAHREAHYRQALAEVPGLPGQTDRRMREVMYLHLTRWLPHLLDRKDRLSMAVGLEVRVPFCDHRLVEYAFNTPWTHHTFDSREKSLLRAAVAPLLPASVLNRTKAPYPVTHDPAYHRMITEQARDLLTTPSSPAWTLLDRERLRARLDRPSTDHATRSGIDFALNLDLWLRETSSLRPTPRPRS